MILKHGFFFGYVWQGKWIEVRKFRKGFFARVVNLS